MTTTPLTPAALAEIRERDAENPNWFRAEAKDVSACFADRHHLLAKVDRLAAAIEWSFPIGAYVDDDGVICDRWGGPVTGPPEIMETLMSIHRAAESDDRSNTK